ncbi:hypothetical protein [Agrobacterium cavarae]|uniref:hypothetical protein n=1 Tax=Agrobacterium cavarae TaxID=2528239 RepID=UPI0028A8DC44|nr:hypothetical protein [Agrobacterium cavarae]
MTNIAETLTAYSSLITATAALIGVVYAAFLARLMLRQLERNRELTQSTQNREFYSHYDNLRLNLERQIADLHLELTKSAKQFDNVNHLILDGQKRLTTFSPEVINPSSFLNSLSVSPDTLKLDRNMVFVLTPFHPSEHRTYSAIVESLSRYGIRVVRGDEEAATGDILSHILREMLSARLVIANISTRNSNVMYELGIAHALGKDVVMIANSEVDLPFDVNSRRILFYKDHEELVEKLQNELARKVFQKS